MPVLRAFRDGISSTNLHLRTVGVLYLANLLLSLALIAPLAFLLGREIGHSAVGETIAFRFDPEFLVDFLNTVRRELDAYRVAVGWGTVAYLLMGAFLSGGVIDTLSSPGRSAYFARFFGGCGKFFFRFARLIPFAAVGLAAVAWINGRLNILLERLFTRTLLEREAFWAMRGKQILILLLLMILAAVLDTARIQSVLMGSTRMTARFLSALFEVTIHLPRTLGIYGLVGALAMLSFLPYLLVAHFLLPAGSVVLMILAQQAMIFVRFWWRVCGLAALMSVTASGAEPPSTAAFASMLGRGRLERIR